MKKIFVFISALALFGCEKVIDVDLNSADPKKVIEANLMAGNDSLLVRITETGDYFNFEETPNVENAIVYLITQSGQKMLAQMTAPGVYWIDSINSVTGENYTIEVTADGKFTTATSYLPPVVPLDSLYFEYFEPSGFFEGGYIPFVAFQDPPNEENYYRLIFYINGEEEKDLNVFNDKFINGTYVEQPLFGSDLEVGDSIHVELRSIDAEVYKFYNTLNAISGGGGPPGVAPGNPTTNLKGDIQLGFFGTYSTSVAKGEFPE